VEETAGWVVREMQAPAGGYYSSLDADSEHEEGKYYVWTPEEVRACLSGEEWAVVEPHYGLDRPPNFEQQHWHLRVAKPFDLVAQQSGRSSAESRALLDAAREAGVPRFIPSDYCIDLTKLPKGVNRNLDWRREFGERLDASPVQGTSVLSGMFMDLLNGPAPVVVPKISRVIYWGDADQELDFTTVENTAAFTAEAALDAGTPRYLRVAGDVANARDLAVIATGVYGKPLRAA
jgi:hypothetical protein